MSVSFAIPGIRRPTYAFLNDAKNTCHVYLMTDVDATNLRKARADSGKKLSYVSLIVKAISNVVERYPSVRLVIHGKIAPSLTSHDDIYAKVLFDKQMDGQRCVLSGAIGPLQHRSVEEIQRDVESHKSSEVGPEGPFRAANAMKGLPSWLVGLAYKVAMLNPRRRSALQGTFSVTCIGNEPVSSILPMIAGAIGFGVGRIIEGTHVEDGKIRIVPKFSLTMAFDHRILDGALASEIMGEVKNEIESGKWE